MAFTAGANMDSPPAAPQVTRFGATSATQSQAKCVFRFRVMILDVFF